MDILALAIPRMSFLALLAALVLLARVYVDLRTVLAFSSVLFLLAAREICIVTGAPGGVSAVADFCILTMYLSLLGRRFGSARAFLLFCLLNAAALTLLSAPSLFVSPLDPLHAHLGNAVQAPVFLDSLFLMLPARKACRGTEKDLHISVSIRCILAFSFISRAAIMYVVGSGNRFVAGGMLLPLDTVHAVFLFDLLQTKIRRERSALSVLSRYKISFLEFVSRLYANFLGNPDSRKIHEQILEFAAKGVNADGGAVFLVEEQENVLSVQAIKNNFPPPFDIPGNAKASSSSVRSYLKSTPIPIEGSFLGEAVKSGNPVFLRAGRDQSGMRPVSSVELGRCRSFIAVPIVVQNRSLGLIAVSRDTEEFTEDDLSYLKLFAQFSAQAIQDGENLRDLVERQEIEKETRIAAEIQSKLIQKNLPRFNGVGIAAQSTPARGVSSDYYDVLTLDKNRIGVAICDVAGKGIPATLVMVMIRSLLHLLASPARNASEVLTWINRGITGTVEIDHFATFSYLVYDHANREITYSNAAHLPLLVCRAEGGRCELVDTEGLPFGIEKATRYTQKMFKLRKGDQVILVTDGVVETMNEMGKQFGMTALVECVERYAQLTPEEQVKKIRQDIARYEGRSCQRDDQTVIVLKVH